MRCASAKRAPEWVDGRGSTGLFCCIGRTYPVASRRRRALHRFDRANRVMILSGVLGQAAIADLPIAERLLDDPEGMFDPGARARLEAFEGIDETAHLGAPIASAGAGRGAWPAARRRRCPAGRSGAGCRDGRHRRGPAFLPHGAGARAASGHGHSRSCPPPSGPARSPHRARCAPSSRNTTAYPCGSGVSRDPLAATVLGRTRRRDQGGVDRRARLQQQAALAQLRIDDLEHRRRKPMGFQHRSTGKRRPSRRRLAGILRRDQRPHSAHGTTRSISSRNTRLRVRFPDNSNPLARLSGFRMHPHPHHQMPAQLPTPRMPFTPGFADFPRTGSTGVWGTRHAANTEIGCPKGAAVDAGRLAAERCGLLEKGCARRTYAAFRPFGAGEGLIFDAANNRCSIPTDWLMMNGITPSLPPIWPCRGRSDATYGR